MAGEHRGVDLPGEMYEIATPRDAYHAAVLAARVDGDGVLRYYHCNGQRGGSIRVTFVDEKFAAAIVKWAKAA